VAVKTLVALDAMVFIYHFDRVDPYFAHTTKLFTKAQQGIYDIVTSLVSLIEVLSPSAYHHAPNIIKEINVYFNEAKYLRVVDVTWDIAQEAARLRREHKYLRTPDAIQLATALVHHADRFITNDTKLKTLSLPGITIQTLS